MADFKINDVKFWAAFPDKTAEAIAIRILETNAEIVRMNAKLITAISLVPVIVKRETKEPAE